MTPLLTTFPKPADPSSSRRTFILLVITLLLLISSVLFGILWIRKCSATTTAANVIVDPYVHWTILHMNDVYELLPLNEGKKGGLARVAHMRDLLLRENPFTYTVLSGDFLSPSALSQAIVNGTMLNGRQMIQTLNTLGVDYVTFGNHEFDLQENELIRRMNESNFTWINSNVFHAATNRTFASSIPYTIVTIRQVRVLLIGLTINAGTKYVDIVDQSLLVPFIQQFLASISHVEYDVLIALTHLDLPVDEQLAASIPQIDLIFGGHEHANYFVRRGTRYTPICKADANAFTVFVHRCAFNLRTKQFRVNSTLALITPDVAEQTKTRNVANYWFNLGMDAFRQMGFEPDKIVSCLPGDVELDGRSSSIRNGRTLLSDHGCQSLLRSTTIDGTTVSLFNVGAMRIDDILTGKITQYDILRVLPFPNTLVTLAVPGRILAKVLTYGMSLKGNGMFLAYAGVESPDGGNTWLINGTDISTSMLNYNLATIDYARSNTGLDDPAVTTIREFNITQTRSLLEYLSEIYPPC